MASARSDLRLHGPVTGAALDQRGAEALRVGAERFGQAKAFVIGGDTGPQDQVVDHLADLSCAEIADMEDRVSECFERRPDCGKGGRVAADHSQHLAGLGRRLAAG
jgi:hypothetical protein